MSPLTKMVLFCCVVLIAATMLLHANQALDPALPNDMPADSRFIPTGYDLEHNERKGSWVSCRLIAAGEDECRVTDAHGLVIYQGSFLPVNPGNAELATSTKSQLRWVHGPAEGAPVPVIPSSDGMLLVPHDDRDALVDRWNQHPDEWQAVLAGQ